MQFISLIYNFNWRKKIFFDTAHFHVWDMLQLSLKNKQQMYNASKNDPVYDKIPIEWMYILRYWRNIPHKVNMVSLRIFQSVWKIYCLRQLYFVHSFVCVYMCVLQIIPWLKKVLFPRPDWFLANFYWVFVHIIILI